MKILLLFLALPFLALLLMLLLPLRVKLNLDIEKGRISINGILWKNFEIRSILAKIGQMESKPKSEFSRLIGKKIAATIRVKNLSIIYITNDGDYAKLALLNGLVAAFLPVIRIMLSNNLDSFYYKGIDGNSSNIIIRSVFYISLVKILIATIKLKRRIRYERKHGRIS